MKSRDANKKPRVPRRKGERQGARQPVLMVDNDPLILDAVGEILLDRGYQVTKAHDGLEALKRFRESHFDLIILDVVLQKIDGHRLCRLIRQDARGRLLPIIAFTALAPLDFAKLPGLSADAYVAKGPLTVAIPNILDAINSVLTRPKRRREPAIFGYESLRPRRIVTELLELTLHYQRVVHALAKMVIELDAHANILSVNRVALQLLGRSELEVTGSSFADLLTFRERSALESLLEGLRKDLMRSGDVITLTLGGSSHRLWCQSVFEDGDIVGFLLTADL